MTEEQVDQAYAQRNLFLEKVRTAFREMKRELTEEQFDFIIYNCQDALSLFSPWMNAND